jgi:hypothetical protein
VEAVAACTPGVYRAVVAAYTPGVATKETGSKETGSKETGCRVVVAILSLGRKEVGTAVRKAVIAVAVAHHPVVRGYSRQ